MSDEEKAELHADAQKNPTYDPEKLRQCANASPNSFSGDTLVTTINGLVPISSITVGTPVLAFDEQSGKTGYYPVTQTHKNLDPAITYLQIFSAKGDQASESITTTPEHPFYLIKTVDGQNRPKPQGHANLDAHWVGAGHLKPGDAVKQADGSVGIVGSVTTVQQKQDMYNLTVDQAHTFTVGQHQTVVHNVDLEALCQSISDAGDALAPYPEFGIVAWGGAKIIAGTGRLAIAGGRVAASAGGRVVRAVGRVFGKGCNSFSPNTPVRTISGLVAISALSLGTPVLAFNEQTGENGYYPITAIHKNIDPDITYLTITDPEQGDKPEFIKTTPEHPFYLAANVDTSPRPQPEGHANLSAKWVGAGHLKIGDHIKQADGTIGVIANVVTVQQTGEMFNLTVSEAHTYYIGQDGWLVHNVGKVSPPYSPFKPINVNKVDWYGFGSGGIGHGMAYHREEFGIPSGRVGKEKYTELAKSVISNPDEVRVGSYAGNKNAQFYRQGDAVAVLTDDGKFIVMARSKSIPSFAQKATVLLKSGCLVK